MVCIFEGNVDWALYCDAIRNNHINIAKHLLENRLKIYLSTGEDYVSTPR